MRIGKPKSKRTPVRLRHKIEKRSAEKQRKQRKLAKQNPQWRSRLKKDPGIPNLFPYKEKILAEIEEKRRAKEEEALKKREEARARREGIAVDDYLEDNAEEGDETFVTAVEEPLEGDAMDAELEKQNPMAALLASARARAEEYAEGLDEDDEDNDSMDEDEANGAWEGFAEVNHDGAHPTASQKSNSSRRAFDKAFQSVVERSDVVLYVVDARDPEGTRSRDVERSIMGSTTGGKRLIFILNKIDLVPPETLQAWLSYLRRSFPTIPLRATGSAPNAHVFNHPSLTPHKTAASLFKALKAYQAHHAQKQNVTVGVIGYPNVGKSSVINALTGQLGRRTVACPVGAEAGITTTSRSIKLDSRLTLIDSPGIVFPGSLQPHTSRKKGSIGSDAIIEEHARLILLNAVPPKEIIDPIPAVTLLLKRMQQSEHLLTKLLVHYNIPTLMSQQGDVTTDFLVHVARSRGRLGHGGVPNLPSAASQVVLDWRDGRIQGWTDPPALSKKEQESKTIVTQWAKEFQLDGENGRGDDDRMA